MRLACPLFFVFLHVMKKWVNLTMFCAMAVAFCASPNWGNAQGNGALFTDENTAKSLFFAGNMHEAARHFDELLRVDSLHYEYNIFAGLSYLNSNIDPSRAIVHFKRALKNSKADPYMHFYLGQAYMLNYQFDEAIESFNDFLQTGVKADKSSFSPQRYIEMCENAKTLISLRNEVTIENVGCGVNSPYPDYNAYVSGDENTLYFTSRQPQNTGGVADDGFKMPDVYCAERVNGKWTNAKKLQSPVNSALVEEVVGATSDGNTLLLYYNNDKGFDDIFVTQKDKKAYSRPEMLSLTVNSEQGEEAAMISPDGNWIFFSSDRPGGFGGYDIYFARKLPNGEWSNAKNAGANINTEYNDNFPYLAPDGETFYFSSQGHNSMGGYDLFRSTWSAAEQFFAIPENLAFPINTPGDNKTISVTESGRYAYIADFRANSTGEVDIYKVTFLDVPAPYSVVKAVVADTDSASLMGQLPRYKVMVRDAGTKKQVGVYRPNLHNGQFTLILRPGFYLVDFYVDDKVSKTQELIIEDGEPDKEIRTIELR